MEGRVLIVEPNQARARQIQHALRRQKLSIEITSNGQSGVAAALRQPPTVVVLSAALADLESLHVCGALRNDPRTASASIVILTTPPEYTPRYEPVSIVDTGNYYLPDNAFVPYTLVELLRSLAVIHQ